MENDDVDRIFGIQYSLSFYLLGDKMFALDTWVPVGSKDVFISVGTSENWEINFFSILGEEEMISGELVSMLFPIDKVLLFDKSLPLVTDERFEKKKD